MDNLIIFEMLQSSINPIGMIEDYISLQYTDYDTEVGNFDLILPYSENNFNLVKRENDKEKIILLSSENSFFVFGICQKVFPQNSKDEKNIEIQGMLIEGILSYYSVGYIERLKTSNLMPTKLRSFPMSLEYVINNLPENMSGAFWEGIQYDWTDYPTGYNTSAWTFADGYVGGRCTFEQYIGSCVRQLKKAYRLTYNGNSNNFRILLYNPVDRTTSQQVNSPVLMSTDFNDILSSQYYLNSKDYKNVIVSYKSVDDEYYEEVVYYDNMTSSFPTEKKRVEYVEAVNVSIYNNDGDRISEENFRGLLKQAGKEALYDAALKSEYSCKLSQDMRFKLGIDYFLGDKITIQDKELGVVIDANITGYTVSISKFGKIFEPINGVSQPSLTRILKKKGVI